MDVATLLPVLCWTLLPLPLIWFSSSMGRLELLLPW